jgi:plastocyanin
VIGFYHFNYFCLNYQRENCFQGGEMIAFNSIRFSMIFRWMLVLAVLLVPQLVQAQWRATVGAESKDKGRQAHAFLPNEIWIHAGDNITWNFVMDEIHTVTFLKAGQTRLSRLVGCPGFNLGQSATFDGSTCVTTASLVNAQTFTVTFPIAGNYKLVCLVHPNMTGVVHVFPLSAPLPHDQDFYDGQAEDKREALLSDRDHEGDHERGHERDDLDSDSEHSHGNEVTAGIGEISATAGGSDTLSVMRFIRSTTVIHAGETVEWTNLDPVTPHTITFGIEPANPMPPSASVTVDVDGARHAIITSPADNVHSGFIVSPPQDRIGLAQAPPGVTRFRVTFTSPGVFPYICALHDALGMKGTVTVLP